MSYWILREISFLKLVYLVFSIINVRFNKKLLEKKKSSLKIHLICNNKYN